MVKEITLKSKPKSLELDLQNLKIRLRIQERMVEKTKQEIEIIEAKIREQE